MLNTRTPFSWALLCSWLINPSRSLSVNSLRPSVSTTTALIEAGSLLAFIESAAFLMTHTTGCRSAG